MQFQSSVSGSFRLNLNKWSMALDNFSIFPLSPFSTEFGITNHELWNVQGSPVCEKFQTCMFTFLLRLKIGNDRIRLCCEFRSCRKFYLGAYGIFVNWFYCYIKIVMKLTSGLFCSLQETIVSALSFYTSEFLFQQQKWGKCVGTR